MKRIVTRMMIGVAPVLLAATVAFAQAPSPPPDKDGPGFGGPRREAFGPLGPALREVELTDKQLAEVRKIGQAEVKEMQAARERIRKEALKKLKAVLTEEQYKAVAKAFTQLPPQGGRMGFGPGRRMHGGGPRHLRGPRGRGGWDEDGPSISGRGQGGRRGPGMAPPSSGPEEEGEW
ncbi:MAG: hypothetical protein IT210_07010 [Armatimonadetes bacterium]|nr:hypothetical protein [Armatimonadota bacterium]